MTRSKASLGSWYWAGGAACSRPRKEPGQLNGCALLRGWLSQARGGANGARNDTGRTPWRRSMQSPRGAAAALPELAHGSEPAATPGASVAALRGGTSQFDTPVAPSPGQMSPARHRSQDEHRSDAAAADWSAGRSGRGPGLEAAAAGLAQAALDSAAAEPLAKPRLRVQGADIILEDAAASPTAGALPLPSSKQQREGGTLPAAPADAPGAWRAAPPAARPCQ